MAARAFGRDRFELIDEINREPGPAPRVTVEGFASSAMRSKRKFQMRHVGFPRWRLRRIFLQPHPGKMNVGYFFVVDPLQYRRDADLDWLRDRDDFKALLAGMEAKKE